MCAFQVKCVNFHLIISSFQDHFFWIRSKPLLNIVFTDELPSIIRWTEMVWKMSIHLYTYIHWPTCKGHKAMVLKEVNWLIMSWKNPVVLKEVNYWVNQDGLEKSELISGLEITQCVIRWLLSKLFGSFKTIHQLTCFKTIGFFQDRLSGEFF